MNFAPTDGERVLHDTWVFVQDADIHLFYLAPSIHDPMHRLIGHALSQDWLNWQELPFIDLTGPAGAWDAGRIGTGHVFQYDNGRFYMAYTGRVDPREDIGIAVSDDLVQWEKLSVTAPIWARALTPPYESDSSERGVTPAWRDPYITKLPDGQWRAWLCAKSSQPSLAGRACVAQARLNNPTGWTTLLPAADLAYYPTMEVPEVFKLGGRWWMTFNVHSGWGRRLDTPSRQIAGGTFYLVAPTPDGSWERPEDNLLIGSGCDRHDAVVARSVEWQGERLLYHHYTGTVAPGTARALGLPKTLEVDHDRLVLRPWSGTEKLRTEQIKGRDPRQPETGPFSNGSWEVHESGISGSCATGAAVLLLESGTSDLDMSLRINIAQGPRAGVAVGGDEYGRGALLLLLDAANDEITLGELRQGVFGPSLGRPLDIVHRTVQRGTEYGIRIVKRDRYAEAFIDDELFFSTITGEIGKGDWLGLVADSAQATFQIDRIHRISPMKQDRP